MRPLFPSVDVALQRNRAGGAAKHCSAEGPTKRRFCLRKFELEQRFQVASKRPGRPSVSDSKLIPKESRSFYDGFREGNRDGFTKDLRSVFEGRLAGWPAKVFRRKRRA